MSWNLFERIINAIKPSEKSEQEPEVSDNLQQWPEGNSDSSQSWPERSTEQPEASEEPSPAFQETPGEPQSNNWQQE